MKIDASHSQVWIHVLRQAGVTVEVCRVAEREKESDPMRNAPKKHKVIRVYRADEGKENSPIDVDGDGDNRDVESEEEMCESENTELDDRPQKRPKVD